MSSERTEQPIIEGSERLGIRLPVEASRRLARYLTLLERWNRAYNLTAVRRALDAMVIRHLLDSLSILPGCGNTSAGCGQRGGIAGDSAGYCPARPRILPVR